MKIFLKSVADFFINGHKVSGSNIDVVGRNVYVNGNLVEQNCSDLKVTFTGTLEVDRVEGSIVVNGEINGNVDAGGSVKVSGDVKGAIHAGGSVSVSGSAGRITAGGSVRVGRG